MTPELTKVIEESREVFITTYDSGGKPGAVPVWFDYHQAKVYISTYPDSLKCRKIRQNPRVKLAFGARRGPSVEGTARFVSEEDVIAQVAPLHSQKYSGGPWRSVEHLTRMWKEARERVLLEVSI